MDMSEFRAQLEEHHWKDCLMAIIFDNSMVWQFNQKERTFNEKTQTWEYGDWMKPEDQLVFCNDGVSIQFKEWLPMKDRTNPQYAKAYYWTVRHVENVQLMCFCDENNLEARPLYPPSMT